MNSRFLKYNSILWNSKTDGPGRRVVLFLQGCQYRCPWCHSPHMQDIDFGLLYFESLCIKCARCEEICSEGVHSFASGIHKIQRDKCTGCGLCVEGCPQSIEGASGAALKIVPHTASVESIYDKLRPQLKYLGAFTISGGEPLLQWSAVKDLLALCKTDGISTAVETTLTADKHVIIELLNLVDVWLVGLRPLDRRNPLLSVPDENITARNIELIDKKRVYVRYPLIPGYTDSFESLKKTKDVMDKVSVRRIELLQFNKHTEHYYLAMGKIFSFTDTTIANTVKQVDDLYRSQGFDVIFPK